MFKTACVVNIKCGCKGEDSKGTGCAILMDTRRGVALAHGSCLAPFLHHASHVSVSPTGHVAVDMKHFMCEVLLERTTMQQTQCSSLEKASHGSHLKTVKTAMADDEGLLQHPKAIQRDVRSQEDFHPYVKFTATVKDVFRCSVVQRALGRLMPESSWELVDRKDTKHLACSKNTDSDADKKLEEDAQQLLSCFILLELHDWLPYNSVIHIRPTSLCQRGDRVEICSTPFGGLKPEAFMNSYSRGIISNLAGEDNCLLLSDARCILGGEGAPLYTFQDDSHSQSARYLTGVVIASLCWKNDEWVGFSVSCALDKVLDSLPSRFSNVKDPVRPIPERAVSQGTVLSSGATHMAPEVVLVKVGPTWGSGVVIDEVNGLVLTCSHVIKDAHRHPVQLKVAGALHPVKSDVIYRQHPLQHQFDLAVVQCGDVQYLASCFNRVVCIGKPEEGLEVFVIGHALFGSEHDLQPSVSSGVISKVLSINNIPVMIQTTCAVHPGASGGALVDRDGRLLGIVVCNARDNTSGASFPHINMSIPVSTVWPLIAKYQRTGDERYLAALTLKNKQVDNIWSLGQSSSAVTPVGGQQQHVTSSKL